MGQNDKEVLLIAQDIKLAKILAGNNAKLRQKTVKLVGKWLKERLEKSRKFNKCCTLFCI